MNQRDVLLQLIQAVYAAPGSLEGWQAVLADVTRALHGSGAHFFAHDFASRAPQMLVTSTLDPEGLRAYDAHWSERDPWAHSPRTPGVSSGQTVSGEQLIPHGELVRTPFYNDFGRHWDVTRSLVGMIEVEEQRLSCVSINRGDRGAAFSSDEVALVQALVPHLQRAIQIHRRLSEAETLTGGFKALLDRLTQGVFLLNASGRIMHANNTAEELLRRNDGLHVCRGEIRAERPSDTTKLLRLIAGVLRGGTSAGGLIVVNRPSGRQPLRLLVAPASHERGVLGTESPAVLVFVSDPERQPVSSCDHLRQLFGFTAAEGRVAMAMLDGESVGTLADRLGISRNTARTHVQRLLAKTDTRRQAELMRVLLGAQLPLRLD